MFKPIVMYKLVSQDWKTHGGMSWEIGKTNRAIVSGNEMCTNQVLHCYASPEQAVLFNPRHANIKNPILLEIHCSPVVNQDGLKYATKEQTPVKQLSLPKFSTKQKVAFAIKCALLVYKASGFVLWAENWLSGVDQTYQSARGARTAAADAANAAYAAASAAASAASAAAYAAADAASAAADADADAANAAYAAASAAASAAAYAAAYAASAAADADADAAAFDKQLQPIIQWVMENIE